MASRKGHRSELRPSGEAYLNIIYALIDKDKRKRLIKLCNKAQERKHLDDIFYGTEPGLHVIGAIPLSIVQEMLEVTGVR